MGATLTVRLHETVAKALAEEAARTSRPKGRIVQEALEAHLRRKRPTALEALRRYAGTVTGPPDLSTGRHHLDDFGRRRRHR